jgi:Flp pilus assembly protein TadD
MTLSAMRGFRRGLLLAAAGIILAAGSVRAQDADEPMPEPQHSRLPPGAVVQPLDAGPGAELRRNLRTLAENPRSLDALIGAGRAAITLGDGESANGFFTRAAQIAPDDPRVRAGMASAMLLGGRPEQALILFAEAVQRGAPEAEIAGDRGLAHDLVGDPRRAQQDYALALRRRDDPEIERRLALSLAISGQRDAALRVIDGQLRRHDRAAWRTQAFVLALTGDPAGADDTARRLMPAPNAEAMAPFFARLAALSPAQKAAAVNFGRFPSDGRATRAASSVDTRADPGALAMAQGGPQLRAPPLAEPVNEAPRRRPDLREQPVNSLIRRPREDVAPAVQPSRRIETAQPQPRRFEPAPADPADEAADEARISDSQPQRSGAGRPREAPAFVPGGNFTLDTSHEERLPQPPVQSAQPSQPVQSATPGFGPIDQAQTPLQRFQAAPVRQAPAFSDIASMVRSLPGESDDSAGTALPARPLTLAERQARDAAAREAEARYRGQGTIGSARTGSAAASRSTGEGRHWVQIAHGAQRGALTGQYRQVRAQAPALIDGRSAWTVADRGTNRLLIGPFDSARGAQDYIDQLSRQQVAAIPWESGAGQSVDRLQGGGASSASGLRETPPDRPAARSTRAGPAETRGPAPDNRRSSRSGSSRATAADDNRPATRGHSGRAAASDDRSTSRTRSGRAAADDRNTSQSRSSRTRAGGGDSRPSATRSSTSRGSATTGRASSDSRSSQSRKAGDDEPRTSRNRSTQERRPAAHDTRNIRGRSSEEQRPAPSRRRPH